MALKLEARAAEAVDAAVDAAVNGDWKALQWLVAEVEGKTPERLEIGVGSLDDLRDMTPAQLAAKRAALVAQFPQLLAG